MNIETQDGEVHAVTKEIWGHHFVAVCGNAFTDGVRRERAENFVKVPILFRHYVTVLCAYHSVRPCVFRPATCV